MPYLYELQICKMTQTHSKDYAAQQCGLSRFSKGLQSVKVLLRVKWDTLRTYYKQYILKLTYKMENDSSPCMKAYIVKFQPSYNLTSLKWEIHLSSR